MLLPSTFVTFVTLLSAVSALTPPSYEGYTRGFSDSFDRSADALPDTSKWQIRQTSAVFNNEVQAYTKKTANIRHTGEGRLQLIPRKDSNAIRGWTSARIESRGTFTPQPGKITRLESYLRIGGAKKEHKQGIWPAFWLMGQSYREGTLWPASGEVDIFENVNGDGICVGVVHCDKNPGGVCNEPIGIAGRTSIGGSGLNTWRVEFDLRKSAMKDQAIVWYKNGKEFHRLPGSQINNAAVWKSLVGQPLYIIFNVAVGGDFPGPPNAKTGDGPSNGMEIGYVAHYVSK